MQKRDPRSSAETTPRPSSAASTDTRTGSSDDGEVLRLLAEGLARSTGDDLFPALVRDLTRAVGTAYACVTEVDEEERERTLAFWGHGRLLDNVAYALAGTPCEGVGRGRVIQCPHGVRRQFPGDALLAQLDVESYVGVPLLDRGGTVLGHLAVFDTRAMPEDPRRLPIVEIFAARAAAELDRMRTERMLRASEQQFRDLYEHAPIAYIYEDTSSRFVSANAAAMRLLGLQAGDVPGTLGLSLIAPTPENQERVHQAIAAIQQGQERAAIELELRRKDDGRPVWVQWWSKPDPDGKYTRTMVVDVTARVLAERERNRLQQQNVYLQEELKSEYNFEEIIGHSSALGATLAKVRQVAPTDSTVLILGETGTGKELVARATHDVSTRKGKPLIKINCSALPTGLVESELFGHEKGAFTGATEKRLGRFALADGGTIFLDEIGDIPPAVQVRLLRVLQEHEFEPVGSAKTRKVDVRVIAATNRDLEAAVADGSFRADLFYRLNVFPIRVPSLRQRREDIPILVHYFMEKYATKIGRRLESISPDTMQRLQAYGWPGNVRELQNVIERAVILSPGPALRIEPHALDAPASVPAAVASAPPSPPPARTTPAGSTLEASQRRHILRALEECHGIIEGPRGAAHVLGLHPNTLRSRMKKLGIRPRARDAAE